MTRIKSKCGKRLNVSAQLLALPLTAPGKDHLTWCVNAYENLRGTQNIPPPPEDEDEQTGIPLSDVVHADGSMSVLEKETVVKTGKEKMVEHQEKRAPDASTATIEEIQNHVRKLANESYRWELEDFDFVEALLERAEPLRRSRWADDRGSQASHVDAYAARIISAADLALQYYHRLHDNEESEIEH